MFNLSKVFSNKVIEVNNTPNFSYLSKPVSQIKESGKFEIPVNYGLANVSNYNPYDPNQTKSGGNGIMASGKQAYEGAVANNYYPLGTRVKIGEKIYTVEDRMNRRYGRNDFDIANMGSKQSASEFGRQKLNYEIMTDKSTSGLLTSGQIESQPKSSSISFSRRTAGKSDITSAIKNVGQHLKESPIGLALRGKFGEAGKAAWNKIKDTFAESPEDITNRDRYWNLVRQKEAGQKISPEDIAFAKNYTQESMRKASDLVLATMGGQGALETGGLKTTIEAIDEVLKNHPGKRLLQYTINRGGELPEVVGKVKSKYGRLGDDIASELGFTSDVEAQNAVDSYKTLLKEKRSAQSQLQVLTQNEKAQAKFKQPPVQEARTFGIDEINRQLGATRSEEISLPGVETKPLEMPKLETNKNLPGAMLETTIPNQEIPSLNSIISQKVPDVKQKVNIFDYFRTPEKVLAKIGLGNEAKLIRQAEEAYRAHLKTDFKYLQGLEAKVPNKESATNIFKFLDGQSIQLSQEEQGVAEEIKIYLKGWADKLELPEDNRITNYITHIFEPDLIKKEFDPELAKLITYKVPGSVYDPFLEQRLGAQGFKENVWQALDAYVKRATRKFNFDPALEQLSKSANKLDLESLNWVKRYAGNINMRPTEVDNLIDNAIKSTIIGYKLGQRPTTVLTRQFRKMIYRGTLGLNISSALRNLTQGVNTYAKLGEKNTILGYVDLARKGTQELMDNGVFNEQFIEDRSLTLTKKLLEKSDKTLFSLFDTVEKINRGSAYYGAKRMALDQGKTIQEAIDFAKQIVRDTQFAFGKVDTPVALASDITKSIVQLQTFNIKQTEFLTDMIKNKEFGGLVRWIGGSLGIVYTVGKLLNMRPQDLIPTVRIGGSPLGSLAGGTTKLLSDNERIRAEGKSQIKKVGWMALPGGLQLKKALQDVSIRERIFGKDYNKPKAKMNSGFNYLSQ